MRDLHVFVATFLRRGDPAGFLNFTASRERKATPRAVASIRHLVHPDIDRSSARYRAARRESSLPSLSLSLSLPCARTRINGARHQRKIQARDSV
jgi:hypothetical protein